MRQCRIGLSEYCMYQLVRTVWNGWKDSDWRIVRDSLRSVVRPFVRNHVPVGLFRKCRGTASQHPLYKSRVRWKRVITCRVWSPNNILCIIACFNCWTNCLRCRAVLIVRKSRVLGFVLPAGTLQRYSCHIAAINNHEKPKRSALHWEDYKKIVRISYQTKKEHGPGKRSSGDKYPNIATVENFTLH